AEHIETKLRVFQTHGLELLLCLVAQHMAPSSPKGRNWFPNSDIVRWGVAIHISCICDFSLRCAVDVMDLAAELLCQGVYARMLQQLIASVIDFWN
ncbi:hypothetical protein HCDG_09530, partial [Histoplasma capsulatum H143]